MKDGNRKPRSLAVLLVLALVAGLAVTTAAAPGALAGKKKKRVERVEEKQYLGATGVRGAADSPCVAEPLGCVVFPVKAGEKFVSVEVTDTAGQPVWASVYVYGYSDGTDAHEHVCGSSEAPFALSGVDEVYVVVTQTSGGATNPCAGPATVGTVTATFSNLP